MKKIKDLIYDYNDIFVAVLILGIAAAVILWRVTDIMDYSGYLAAREDIASGLETPDFTDVDLTQTDVEDFNTDPEDFNSDGSSEGADGQTTDGQDTDEQTPDGQGQTGEGQIDPNADNQPVRPAGDRTVVIPSGSSGARIAQILAENGLIADPDGFLNTVIEMKADSKLKAGTFTIPEGSSAQQIIEIITK